MHRLQELVRLHRSGVSSRRMAMLLAMSRNTVRQYREALATADLLDGPEDALPEEEALVAALQATMPSCPPRQEVSTVDAWAVDIGHQLRAGVAPRAIYDWLRAERPDFTGSYDAVKRYARRMRQKQPVKAEDVAIRVETAPGQVAQVDFGYLGLLRDPATGKPRKAWVFVLVLGFSRHMYAEIVFDQRSETWQRLHAAAFTALGGVPAVLVPDNLKAAVIRAAFTSSDEGTLNRSYVELARYYGFQVDPTPPRDPQKKGKVEAGVKYVTRNFWEPRKSTLVDIVQANTALRRWVAETAGLRVHGTTHLRPLEVFEDIERVSLKPLPVMPFAPVVWHRCKLHTDSHVYFAKGGYSAPWKLLGQVLWLRARGEVIELFGPAGRVAVHKRARPGTRETDPAHLPPDREAWAHRDRPYWEDRAAKIGPTVLSLVSDIFEADKVQLQLRTVQAIVTTLEKVPTERAEATARRARFYHSLSVGAVKEILRKGLDLQPLPGALVPTHGALTAPRFARLPGSFTTRTPPEA